MFRVQGFGFTVVAAVAAAAAAAVAVAAAAAAGSAVAPVSGAGARRPGIEQGFVQKGVRNEQDKRDWTQLYMAHP